MMRDLKMIMGKHLPKALACCGVIMLAFGVSPSFASNKAETGYRSIASISTDSEGMRIELNGPSVTPNSSCVNKFIIHANTPFGQPMRDAATNAYSGGGNISITFSSDETDCWLLIDEIKAQ